MARSAERSPDDHPDTHNPAGATDLRQLASPVDGRPHGPRPDRHGRDARRRSGIRHHVDVPGPLGGARGRHSLRRGTRNRRHQGQARAKRPRKDSESRELDAYEEQGGERLPLRPSRPREVGHVPAPGAGRVDAAHRARGLPRASVRTHRDPHDEALHGRARHRARRCRARRPGADQQPGRRVRHLAREPGRRARHRGRIRDGRDLARHRHAASLRGGGVNGPGRLPVLARRAQ